MLKLRTSITESFEGLLKALAELYEGSICCSDNLHPELDLPDSSKLYAPDSSQSKSVRSKIVDMDLDGDDDVEGSVPASAANLKLNFVSIISNFFTVVPVAAWDVMFNLMLLVLVSLLSNLCEHPYWSSDRKSFDLVVSMTGMVDMQADLKLECLNVVVAISRLLQTLILSLNTSGRDSNDSIDENQRLCEGEKLLVMLQDPDYRVRLNLARRIGVLFQTWDGHDELFRDICSNFGGKLVSSKKRLVMAAKVLKAGPYPPQKMETIIITLMHLALNSEKMELETVFIMCAIAAIDPCQRELIGAVFDNLSKTERLNNILSSWVACGVSLVALMEARGLFCL
ncbi:hypothetical protein POM88_021969 [Heracleum sosnowskyi]|uniref:Uncharacterized protein n=1 Tax=Heracleum sosnowskyi TaxID=360622 RepID=A0AAD8IEE7_9APIA|nr:hypothetical protein POM88_021969 [Heracleum sosnowskyi]